MSKFRDTGEQLCFQRFSNSWVALNSNPKGIIQFIGSFVFGSFPLNSYKSLFQNLFEQGYTIFVFRFPFNPLGFNHWRVATNLLQEEYKLRVEIIRFLTQNQEKYQNNLEIYLNDTNYYWLGHSLGCKYISLLEILSNDTNRRQLILQKSLGNRYNSKLKSCIKSVDVAREEAEQKITALLNQTININKFFIKDQPSIFLAPEISYTVTLNGITISTTNFIPRLNLLIYPNVRETKCMICQSTNLFNLTGIISFAQDFIARDDVSFLLKQLYRRRFTPPLHQELSGCHFEPNGMQIEHLGTCINQMFTELRQKIDVKPS
ncbi:MAG: DUF1350 family protein [Nostocaceae cyanobacterium]|nr:DUF1350 family protein [Nostocaceae cyanobacterium]